MPAPVASVSAALVAGQFAALAVLVAPWGGTWHAWGWTGILLAAVVGTWTLRHNPPGNFGVMPEPKAHARLVTTGPYAFVRHPMYLAVLLFVGGCLAGWQQWPHAAAFAALAVVLHAKALREEALLARRFPEYAAYKARTKRLVPFVL
jgi:protein-S-isoprenylcysteine O-methyltransferase Ste14